MPNAPKLALIGLAVWAVGSAPSFASDLPLSGGYLFQNAEEEIAPPRIQRRVTVDEEMAPRVQRRIVERHIIERYVEEPVERRVVRRAEPVLAPPLSIRPVERVETRVRVQAPTVIDPVEERRYMRPVVERRIVSSPVQEPRVVRLSPPVEECRTVVNRRIDGFGFEEVTRTRTCN